MIVKVTLSDEEIIHDIGHAFGYYDYGAEHGLADAFPDREAVAAFICGYVRMASQSGMLYTTGERGEGYIAYKLPGQKVGARAALPLAKAFFSVMKPRDIFRFVRIMSQGGSGPSRQLDREKKLYIFVGMVCVRERFQGQGYMRRLLEPVFAEGDRLGVPVQSQSAIDTYISEWSLRERAGLVNPVCCTI